jgi:sugar (pentulose or hexulose) kinase
VTATGVVIGLDLGTTSSKAMVRDLAGREVALVAARTPWTTVHGGTQTTADALLALAVDVLVEAVGAAERQIGAVRVLGVGLAGLGESGVLLDAAGEPCAPVIAWFDKRGGRELEVLGATAPAVQREFAGRTGLPWDSQASFAKLLWLQSAGYPLTAAHRWSSVPEWVVHRLGGDLVREPSLASRTGLVDQGSGDVWEAGLWAAGLPRRSSRRRCPREPVQACCATAGFRPPCRAPS